MCIENSIDITTSGRIRLVVCYDKIYDMNNIRLAGE